MRTLFLQAMDTINDRQIKWALVWAGKWLLLILALTLYTLIVARASDAKAAEKYENWKGRYVTDFLAQQDAVRQGMPTDPETARRERQAQALARVLYGVRDNSSDDLRTYCWCVFNRVDSPEYPDTLEDVIAQPSQWMRYSEENPVLENLYQIAAAELDAWENGTTRPVAAEYVFMTWSPQEIVLRNSWENTSRTRYWRMEK